MVYILVEIDDISVIIRDKFRNFRDYTRLILTMQEHYSCWFHILTYFLIIVQSYTKMAEQTKKT